MKALTDEEKEAYECYMNVADETWYISPQMPGLTLEDLEPAWVEKSKVAAQTLNLPWPPYLPAAEEFCNDHFFGGR